MRLLRETCIEKKLNSCVFHFKLYVCVFVCEREYIYIYICIYNKFSIL